jgi:hypothetical protein
MEKIIPFNLNFSYISLTKRWVNFDLRNQLRKKWEKLLPSRYEPAYGLPDKSLIVVRSTEISRFIEEASGTPHKKESSRQRNTIIGTQGGISADTALLLISTLAEIAKQLSPTNRQSQKSLYHDHEQEFERISVAKSTFDKVLGEANRLKKSL